MVNKLVFQSVINKYYLGENESVKWKIKDKTLTIDFMSINREVIGKITHSPFDLEDSELAIFDTKKLLSLLSITQGDIMLSVEKGKSTCTKMLLADSNFNLTYALADPLLISKVGTATEPNWDAILPLEPTNIENLIKAKNALSGIDLMILSIDSDELGNNVCVFTFGDSEGHNNKITYNMYGEIKLEQVKILFNSNTFKNILHANRDAIESSIFLNYQGLMKLVFKTKETLSEYYLICKEESAF